MGTLRALNESEVMLTDLREDLRGREVRDIAGEKIGTVDEVLVDDREKQVRLVLVGAGGFLGLENTQVLIPVDAIIRITDAEVYIRRTRRHAAGAPLYDSRLVDQRYLESVYAYYGYYPYWAPCYSYPRHPAFP
ncbi:MAG TPA: PRC-barrel domain-containing protein [Gemmatimonadales bacterium]|nr:PRC-barrel domain-containing protein [Gemmatimonadales bacterium]